MVYRIHLISFLSLGWRGLWVPESYKKKGDCHLGVPETLWMPQYSPYIFKITLVHWLVQSLSMAYFWNRHESIQRRASTSVKQSNIPLPSSLPSVPIRASLHSSPPAMAHMVFGDRLYPPRGGWNLRLPISIIWSLGTRRTLSNHLNSQPFNWSAHWSSHKTNWSASSKCSCVLAGLG